MRRAGSIGFFWPAVASVGSGLGGESRSEVATSPASGCGTLPGPSSDIFSSPLIRRDCVKVTRRAAQAGLDIQARVVGTGADLAPSEMKRKGTFLNTEDRIDAEWDARSAVYKVSAHTQKRIEP
jgi:hypothetical protein